ncbi:vesicle-associated protein 2-1 isoform X2 [Amborella trichopoda]|uniref:vesicle-associated protein 2-1 isoform X2 n=1 Tax=Amborella trichopoda TaxID=13333 RepID=UPI0005D38592|nr:vesicle-associated protein 2-1 isoform X2 [Amborella trichopoda]|eukprot:XP_011621518.1 vesicle-associated protein 2-1 isoform X2 [Amborella trichopoda]
MSSQQLISVYPEDLIFPFVVDKISYCNLKVVNNTEHHVAFKVKTTSPKKYFVRPNFGIILPWDSLIITVTMQAQKESPPDLQSKDKFLLQSTIVPSNIDIDEMPADTFNKDAEKNIEECKLRVFYTHPSGHQDGLCSPLSRNLKQHSDYNSIDAALSRLKEERDTALQQNRQLLQELEMLKRQGRRRKDSGFSVVFAAFVGALGILAGYVLNLAFTSPSTE